MNTLEEFREAARENDMPDDAIDYWVRLARPCLALNGYGDGPVVGYFGGRPALPASVAWPAGHAHLASLDLATIPKDATDLDLPTDGTLVFFAVPEMTSTTGRVVHLPAGAVLAEAEPPDDAVSVYDRFPLHGTPDWSMPEDADDSLRYRADGPRDDEELFEEITWDLDGPDGLLLLGGFGSSNTGGLRVPVANPETHLLLAEFILDESTVGEDFDTDCATVFYVSARDDLAARTFDAVWMATDFHG